MSRMVPAVDCPEPPLPVAAPPSMEFSMSLSGLPDPLARAKIAAQGLRDLILIWAEDVADDLFTVTGVNLVEINPAIDQVARMVAERSSQGRGARGILGVRLHSAKERGDRVTGGLFGGGLVNSPVTLLRASRHAPSAGARLDGAAY